MVSTLIELTVRVEAEFTFYVHDSIDDEDLPIGSDTIARDEEVEATILIHFLNDEEHLVENSGDPHYVVADVEIVDFPKTIDIGYVSYSLAGDDDDFHPDDWVSTKDDEDDQPPPDPELLKDMPF